jgi:tRNA pseudouridine32 synthase/23S rRNA pseudouridine746 synthase
MWDERILFEDAEALVIDKPAGLAVHPGPARAKAWRTIWAALKLGFQRLPQPVPRLDRDTSGCLLLARNPKALKRFAQAFEAGAVEKRYLAIVEA